MFAKAHCAGTTYMPLLEGAWNVIMAHVTEWRFVMQHARAPLKPRGFITKAAAMAAYASADMEPIVLVRLLPAVDAAS